MITSIQACKFFQRWNKGEFPHQRMGQAFINHFKIECKHDDKGPCLFYEPANAKAAKHIWTKHVCAPDQIQDRPTG